MRKFAHTVKLTELRSFSKLGGILENMQLLRQGRLSVSAVKPKEWEFILSLAGEEPSQYGRDAGLVDATASVEGVRESVNGLVDRDDTGAVDAVDESGEGEGDADDGTDRSDGGSVDGDGEECVEAGGDSDDGDSEDD